jgi:hypothetical protein
MMISRNDPDLNLGVDRSTGSDNTALKVITYQEATEDADEEKVGRSRNNRCSYWMAIKALQEAQVRIETLEELLLLRVA